MRLYNQSDIFMKMNTGNAIYNQIVNCVKSIDDRYILNDKLSGALDTMYKAYKETTVLKAIDDVKNYDIILVAMSIDKRLPANMPYIRTKRSGRSCVIVDLSKYCTVKRDSNDKIMEANCDIAKLYNTIIPAFLALHVLNNETIISTETTKWMAYLWARLFNKILRSQKFFVDNAERYEAFMYFCMKFFMIYYLQTPPAIVEKIAMEFIKNEKSKYILMVEHNLENKKIDIYSSFTIFVNQMFSNEITNIRTGMNGEMSAEQYIRLFSNSMGRDGAYMSLWSADYFLYCLFVTFNKAYILNDRAWDYIVNDNPKIMPRVMLGLYKEI